MNEWKYVWMSDCMNGWIHGWMNEWLYGRMNENRDSAYSACWHKQNMSLLMLGYNLCDLTHIKV